MRHSVYPKLILFCAIIVSGCSTPARIHQTADSNGRQIAGKPGAPISIQYELESPPAPHQILGIAFQMSTPRQVDFLNIRLQLTDGLEFSEPSQSIEYKLDINPQGHSRRLVINVIPTRTGTSYLHVFSQFNIDGAASRTVHSIPVRINSPQLLTPQGSSTGVRVTEDGKAIYSIKGQQTGH